MSILFACVKVCFKYVCNHFTQYNASVLVRCKQRLLTYLLTCLLNMHRFDKKRKNEDQIWLTKKYTLTFCQIYFGSD